MEKVRAMTVRLGNGGRQRRTLCFAVFRWCNTGELRKGTFCVLSRQEECFEIAFEVCKGYTAAAII